MVGYKNNEVILLVLMKVSYWRNNIIKGNYYEI